MKKILLASTGLIAASMLATSPASAEGLEFKVGGKVQNAFGFADQDMAGLKDFDMTNDTEVYFTGSMKLDNGITVGGRVELESSRDTAGRHGDIQYVWLTSDSLGTLEIGETSGFVERMHNSAPDVGAGWNTRHSVANYVLMPGPGRTVMNRSEATAIVDDKDMKIQYMSPSFSGFSVAAQYTPDNSSDTRTGALTGGPANGIVADTPTNPEMWGVSAAYSGEYDGFSVGADVAYGQMDASGIPNELELWHAGLSVGFGGFLVAGSYFNGDHPLFVDDYEAYNIGASYRTGPWGVSVSWVHTNDESGTTLGVGPGPAFNTDDEVDLVHISGSYALGPGASLFATIGIADYNDASAGPGNADNEGWAGIGGIKLSF